MNWFKWWTVDWEMRRHKCIRIFKMTSTFYDCFPAQWRAEFCNNAEKPFWVPTGSIDDLVIFWGNGGSSPFHVQCQLGRPLWRHVSVLLCLSIPPPSSAHFPATAGWRHHRYFDVSVARRLFLMRTEGEPTLWSSCFHVGLVPKWSNHICVYSNCYNIIENLRRGVTIILGCLYVVMPLMWRIACYRKSLSASRPWGISL